jgi:serine/threonine protein kinase/tetratricopeptide (TPR) repeat protein
MADPKSGETPDADSGLPSPPEGEKTLSEGAFGRLPLEERVRSGHSSFPPHSVLANRFRVVRFIARGGMGEVYEAEDLELHERVAVKCIRFEYAQHEHAVDRFRREIQLARRVTHPNVCRTYDVFRHLEKGAEEEGQEILIVSMELLGGKTLSQEISEKGKLTAEQSLPIILQMVAGLGAAHQAGIVHRDFKSANVLLIPSERSPDGMRVVVTDFGLARETAAGAARLTGTLDVIGTPAYMAPEQLNGGEISPATDIYALGIVMYEMLTGNVPYSGDTAIAMALRRLSEPAPSPSTSVPGLDPQWEATVLRCLERQPEDRFANTEEILQTIRGEITAPPRRHPARPRNTMQRWGAAALVAAILACGVWYAYRRDNARNGLSNSAPVTVEAKTRPSVAVLGFQNMTETASSGLLGDMLTDGLWSQLDTDEIRFIPPSQVDEMKRNLGITGAASSLDGRELARVQEYLGCDTVITGSYRASPDAAGARKIEWNIHLLGKGAAAAGGAVQTTGTESDLNAMVARAGKLIRAKLGVELSVAEESRLDNSLSTNTEALRYFSEAREKRRSFDVAGAIKALQKAVAADPDFAQAHSALAESWSDLGYEAKAAEEAKKAFDLSSKLSAETRGLITGRYNEMIHDWPKAIENYASLRTLFVDDPEYGLLLARSQTSAGKGQAALATLDQTQQKKLPKGLDAQLELARSEAQESLGDFHRQLSAASAATEKAKLLQSNLLLARTRIQECSALLNLGDAPKARPLCEEARKLNTDAGDQAGAARAINVVANAAYQQGDLAEAKKLYEQALSISEMIGDKVDESGALNNLANILDDQGDHEGAVRTYEKSIKVAKDRGDKPGLGLAQQNLGVVYFESGNAKSGGEMLQRAILIAREVGDKSTEATILNNLCMLSLEAGEPRKAHEHCQNSLRLRTEIDSKPDVAKSLVSRGSIEMAEADLAGARKSYEDGLQMQESLGLKSDAAFTRIALSRLAIAEKRFDDAQILAGDAAAELASEKDANGEAEARALLGEAKAGRKDVAGAQAELATARKLTATSTDKKTKLRVQIAEARITREAGQNQEAVDGLLNIEKEARGSGWLALGLEAKLTRGQTEIHAGKASQGKMLLAELSREAKARGFTLLSEEAARMN